MGDIANEGITQTVNNLRVATLLHFSGSLFDKLTKQVFLFDPEWIPSNTPEDVDTLPFVWLEVVKEEIVQTNSVSKKRLILFESEEMRKARADNGSYRPSVVHVVADNIVNEPLIHKLECLLPANALGKLFTTTMSDARNVAEFISSNEISTVTRRMTRVYDPETDTSTVVPGELVQSEFLAGLRNVIEVVRAVLTAIGAGLLLIQKTLDLIKVFSGSSTDFNRKSLLSMARRRTILKYKHWASWETKNVTITGMNISKVGTEDDYFRLSLELQEMPILYVGPFNADTISSEAPSGLNVTVGNAVKEAFKKLIGAAEKAGG